MKKRAILVAVFLIISTSIPTINSKAVSQKKVDYVCGEILDICTEYWHTYHCYPSCCAMMAAQESLFGTAGRPNNLWGLAAGRASYNSLREGIIAWMKCVNNGWYPGANKANSGDSQLACLLAHGYCQLPGTYFQDAMRLKAQYNLAKLDERMFKRLERKKKQRLQKARKKQQKLMFYMVYDPELLPYQVVTYDGAVIDGALRVRSKNDVIRYRWMDVIKAKKGKHRIIYTGDRMLALEQIVWLDEVREGAVG